MAGVLSFALGLETTAFAGALDRAGGRLLAFLSVGKAVELAVDGVMNAIERGAALNDLSNRTGESVANLYQLQEAFNVVGISVDALPGMINRFNKSLSGVGEMGEKTSDAFAALGLSTEDLKKMDAPGQMMAVAEAIGQLDRGSAVDVASRLFGREGAANLLQISRDTESFKQTLTESAREAAVFARNAAAFDAVGDTVARIKGNLSGMFAGIAEGIVPTIQNIADALKELDLVTIGQNIGTMFKGAFQAFSEGKLSILISDTVVAGFQMAAELLPGIFQKIGVMILRLFEEPLIYLQSFMEYIAQQIETMGSGQSFEEILAERRQKGAEFFTQGNTIDQLNQAANDSLSAGVEGVKEKWATLFSEFADFASRGPQAAVSTASKTNSGNTGDTGSINKPNVSSLEKMGFVMSGGSIDSNKQTAANTRRSADYLKLIHDKIDKTQPQTLSNR